MGKRIVLSAVAVFAAAACGDSVPKPAGLERTSSVSQALDDDSNCGAVGYACVGGRTCSAGACTPAWLPMDTTDAPDPRWGASAVSIDGKYVVSGGCTTLNYDDPPSTTVSSYDSATDTWTSTYPLSEGRALHASLAVPGGLGGAFVHGGLSLCYDGTVISGTTERLGVSGWESVTSDLPPVYDTSLAWTGSGVLLFGGSTNTDAAVGTGVLATLGGSPGSVTLSESFDAFCPLEQCIRGGQYNGFLDGSTVRFWGGGPWGDAPNGLEYDPATNSWSHWTVPDGTPYFTDLNDSYSHYGDDGRRMFYYDRNVPGVRIYDRTTQTWSVDSSSPTSGLCSEGAAAWTGSELVVWSGLCDGNLE